MSAGADTPSRTRPSSVTQLPILTALYAGFPTLFSHIIHDERKNVNSFFKKSPPGNDKNGRHKSTIFYACIPKAFFSRRSAGSARKE